MLGECWNVHGSCSEMEVGGRTFIGRGVEPLGPDEGLSTLGPDTLAAVDGLFRRREEREGLRFGRAGTILRDGHSVPPYPPSWRGMQHRAQFYN